MTELFGVDPLPFRVTTVGAPAVDSATVCVSGSILALGLPLHICAANVGPANAEPASNTNTNHPRPWAAFRILLMKPPV